MISILSKSKYQGFIKKNITEVYKILIKEKRNKNRDRFLSIYN